MRKIIYSLLLLSMTFSLQSCLHDDEEIFDKPAAQRLSETITADKELLESATNGWKLTYFTGQDYSGGGYTFFTKFKNGKAYVSGDIADSTSITSSDFDVVGDQGPVLTFNTYNEIMHYMAQPYITDVDGEQGDYEFVIMKTSQDTIIVKGKKWGNIMTMTRVADTLKWSNYLADIAKMEKSFEYTTFKSVVDGVTYHFEMNTGTRQMSVYDDNSYHITIPYYVTPTGISFNSPISLGNGNKKNVCNFIYNAKDLTMSCSDEGATDVKLDVELPAYYMNYEDFAGDYTFKFNKTSIKVALVPAGDNKSYYMVSDDLGTDMTPMLTYNKIDGTLSLCAQALCKKDDHYVCMLAWSLSSGGSVYLSYSNGMKLQWDNTDTSGTVLKFSSLIAGTGVDSFILADSSDPNISNDSFIGWSSTNFGYGSYKMPYLKTMTKIK
nr:DUF4302 domain-containing protein [Prevotella sp.]